MTKMRNQSTDPVYTLGVASRLTGIPVHSVRQYIDKGLLLPYKTETNRHLFSETDIKRLNVIKKYLDQGLNVAGIKSLYSQIPGFLIKPCEAVDCEDCVANKPMDVPCWMANKQKTDCSHRECRTCEVYQMADPIIDLKNYFLNTRDN